MNKATWATTPDGSRMRTDVDNMSRIMSKRRRGNE
jgi:hypothetical protein